MSHFPSQWSLQLAVCATQPRCRDTGHSNGSHPGLKASCPVGVNLSCNKAMGTAAKVSTRNILGTSLHTQGSTNTSPGIYLLFGYSSFFTDEICQARVIFFMNKLI